MFYGFSAFSAACFRLMIFFSSKMVNISKVTATLHLFGGKPVKSLVFCFRCFHRSGFHVVVTWLKSDPPAGMIEKSLAWMMVL